jgi:hypothetical protein
MYRLQWVPKEGECTSCDQSLFVCLRRRIYQQIKAFLLVCLLEAENVPANQGFTKRVGRMYQLHLGQKRETVPAAIRLPTTHNLVEEGEYTAAIDVRHGEQTSKSDKTPQQQDSAQPASVIKAHTKRTFGTNRLLLLSLL